MNKGFKSFILALILTAAFAFPVSAASSNFLSQATKFYNRICKLRYVPENYAFQCYVFDKVGEMDSSLNSLVHRVSTLETKDNSQDQKIQGLQDKNASQDAEITDLKTKVSELGNSKPADPTDIIFFNGKVSPQGAVSQVFDAQKYSKVTFTYQGTSSAFVVEVSGNQTDWFTQYIRGEGENKAGGSVTLDSAGRYYRVEAGSTTLPPNEVHEYALGHFFN